MSRKCANICVVLISLIAMPYLKADPYNWTATNGDWSDPTNWGGTEPGSMHESAMIANGGTAIINQPGEMCNGLFLGNYGEDSGTILMTGGNLSTNYSTIGNLNTGYFIHSGGIHSVQCDIDIGFLTRNSDLGTYILSDSAQLTVGMHEYIGRLQSNGLFVQSGGVNTTPYLLIGKGNRYELTGGTLQINGGLQNNGSINCINGNAKIDIAPNSIVNLSNGDILNANNTSLSIGENSLLIIAPGFNPSSVFGSYSNAGKTHVLGTTLNIAEGESLQGCADIDDFVDCRGTLKVPSGYQSINLNGGLSLSDTGFIDIGGGDLTTEGNTSNISGGILSAQRHFVGWSKTGSFDQSGGSSHSGYLMIGQSVEGTYRLSGTGYVSADNCYVGVSGKGTFIQSGGELFVFGDLMVGLSTSGVIDQSGGIVRIGDGGSGLHLSYATSSTATYNLTGGTLVLKEMSAGDGKAAFNFGGGTLQASAAMTTALPMSLTGLNGNANVNTNGFAVTHSGVLSGPGGLNKIGSNTLTLDANNTFEGPTNVTSGTLALKNTGALANSRTICVASGAILDVSALDNNFSLVSGQTLTGMGKIVGNLTVNGTHAPGNSPGIETVQGNYNMLGELQIELMGTTAGSGYDQVLLGVNGSSKYNATLGGLLTLDWTGMNDSTDASKLWILRNDTTGTLSGEFSNYANGASLGLHDGREWQIWYGADSATGNLTGGNDVLIAPVPEPATIVLLALALFGLFGWSRKRQA